MTDEGDRMAHRYSAFLLRHWHIGDDGARRVEVVHIQSSARAVVSSLGAATDWIDALSRDLPPPPAGAPNGPLASARCDSGTPQTYPSRTTRVTAPGDLVPKQSSPESALPTRGRRSDAEGTAGRIGVKKSAATMGQGDDCVAPAENEQGVEEKS